MNYPISQLICILFFVFANFFFLSAASFAYRLQRGKVEQLNEIRLKRKNGI